MTWDIPIRISSRRARGVRSKEITAAGSCRTLRLCEVNSSWSGTNYSDNVQIKEGGIFGIQMVYLEEEKSGFN